MPTPRHVVAMSPDGTRIVYAASDRLYLQSLSELEAHPIAGSEAPLGVAEPTFSPDGRSLAFWSSNERAIKIVPVDGGSPVTVCPVNSVFGLSWSGDTLFFGVYRRGIMRVSAGGDAAQLVVTVADDEQPYGPQLLPDGDHLLFTLASGYGVNRWENARVVTQSLASGERRVILENATDARYLKSGHLVYAARDGVFAVRFDAQSGAVAGPPVASMAGVRRSNGRATGAAQFSVSDAGSLVYVPGALSRMMTAYMEIRLADRQGRIEKIPLPAALYKELRVSGDGKQFAISAKDPDEETIYIYDRSGATTMRRLTFGGNNRAPVWTADHQHVAFQSDRGGDAAIYWQRVDGSAPAERLTSPAKGEAHFPESWDPRGGGFLFSAVRGDVHTLWFHSLPDGKAAPFGEVRSLQPIDASFSPDGHWVAYSTMEPETGERGIFVQPFPATGARYPLFVGPRAGAPSNSNHKPAWSPDGKELFYVPRLGDLEVVTVTTKPAFAFGKATSIPREFTPGPPDMRRAFDITPDGKFLAMQPVDPSYAEEMDNSKIQVVLNWLP